MKILFDTNVLMAAFTTRGICSELFEHCLTEHIICTSQWILDELHKNLVKKFGFPRNKVDQVLNFLRENMLILTYSPLPEPICRDPNNDHILASALSGKVDCIISGDDDLLVLKRFQEIPILKPCDFWKFEKEKLK